MILIRARLHKILSERGVCSRRRAEALIAAGKVLVNGEPATIGLSADPDADEIEVDGVPIPPEPGRKYILLYKPKGYVTTVSDERGRPNVTELVPDSGVYPAGRLDLNSEGLIILTNDGEFAKMITHPGNGVRKTYIVWADGDVSAALPGLRTPLEIDGKVTRPATVRLLKTFPSGGMLEITIGEGRNRHIRRLCEREGLRVRRLKREAIGCIRDRGLSSGEWRYLSADEVASLSGNGGAL